MDQQTKMSNNTPEGYIDIIETQLTQKLGASDVLYTEKVTLFIAHKNSNGETLINIADWIFEAERVLANIGGGSTSVQVRGAWLGQRDQPLHEETTLVYSYATPQAILDNIVMLRHFLHRYGRESVQGEVALLLENTDGQWFYRVHPPYDPE